MTEEERRSVELRQWARIQEYHMMKDRYLDEWAVPGEFARISAEDVTAMHLDLMPFLTLHTSDKDTIALFVDALQRAEIPSVVHPYGDMVGGISFEFKSKVYFPECKVKPTTYILRLSPHEPSRNLGEPFEMALEEVRRRLSEGIQV